MTVLSSPVTVWLLFINLLAFVLFGTDKFKAKRHAWRISEAALLATAVLGGGAGALLGMRLFHHKTRHPKFAIGVPVILILELLLGLVLFLFRSGVFLVK